MKDILCGNFSGTCLLFLQMAWINFNGFSWHLSGFFLKLIILKVLNETWRSGGFETRSNHLYLRCKTNNRIIDIQNHAPGDILFHGSVVPFGLAITTSYCKRECQEYQRELQDWQSRWGVLDCEIWITKFLIWLDWRWTSCWRWTNDFFLLSNCLWWEEEPHILTIHHQVHTGHYYLIEVDWSGHYYQLFFGSQIPKNSMLLDYYLLNRFPPTDITIGGI